jgi:hypothetical protein
VYEYMLLIAWESKRLIIELGIILNGLDLLGTQDLSSQGSSILLVDKED